MAILLFRYLQKKRKERETQKAIPTTDDSHLVPEHTTQEDGLNEHSLKSLRESTGSHVNHLTPEEAAQQKAEARRNNIRHWKLMLGLVLPNFLAAMDVTIVAPAIPLISSHFDRLSGSFNWIVAAYTLTFTTFIPVSGQLADIYGRHFALQFEMFWIMVGSILCASAQSWAMLLVGRALQGLGAAGIMSLSRIILSDGTSLAKNSSSNSVLSLISGCSYAVGPVIGGFLADAGWRYIFVLPIGVSVLAMLVIALLMRKELVQGRARSTKHQSSSRRLGYISGLAIIDWPGITMFILGVGCIILAMQWGGNTYSWSSPAVVAPFTIGGILCILFFIYEYLLGPGRAVARFFPRQIPMIPSTLFRKKDTSLLMVINFSAGISLVAAFYFISYYWQLAEGYSPSKAGLQLLYYTPGLGVGVYSALAFCNYWPRQTFFPLLLGSIVEGVGLALLTYSISIRDVTLVKVFLAVAGAGTGLRFMPCALHAAGTWSTRVPSMQSLLAFMLPLGETVGISMMGSVFSNKLSMFLSQISRSTHGIPFSTTGPPTVGLLDSLPPSVKNQVQDAAAKAIMWALVSVLPFMGLSILASLFLGNVWIGKGEKRSSEGKVEREEQKGKVMYGVYLMALFTGSIGESKMALDVDLEREEVERTERVEGEMRV